MLDAIGLSRSTYYYELSKTDKIKERNAELSSEITVIFNENRKRYGVRRVHHELLNRGFQVNHKRVQRIMNQLELFGKRPKEKYHSYKGDVGKVADNIINRDFSTEKPLQKWTTDEAFSKAIADYIDYYNNSRIQAKTKWMPPSKFREASMMEP